MTTTLEQARAQFSQNKPVEPPKEKAESESIVTLQAIGIDPHEGESDNVPQTLRGLDFALTGRLSRTRKKISAQIVAHGGCVHPRVNDLIDFVVKGQFGKARRTSIKLNEAKSYGISVISEAKLHALMKGE